MSKLPYQIICFSIIILWLVFLTLAWRVKEDEECRSYTPYTEDLIDYHTTQLEIIKQQ